MPTLAVPLDAVAAWVANRDDVLALALVGSHARDAARERSDIDLVLLTQVPDAFRASAAWLDEIDWSTLGVSVASWHDAQHGVVWSRHVELSDGELVEFSFAHPGWASTSPVDPGTRSVVSNGCRVLFDPGQLLKNVLTYAA